MSPHVRKVEIVVNFVVWLSGSAFGGTRVIPADDHVHMRDVAIAMIEES